MPNSALEKGWKLQFGASVGGDGTAEFRVWAPNLTNLAVRILENAAAYDSHETFSEFGGLRVRGNGSAGQRRDGLFLCSGR